MLNCISSFRLQRLSQFFLLFYSSSSVSMINNSILIIQNYTIFVFLSILQMHLFAISLFIDCYMQNIEFFTQFYHLYYAVCLLVYVKMFICGLFSKHYHFCLPAIFPFFIQFRTVPSETLSCFAIFRMLTPSLNA